MFLFASEAAPCRRASSKISTLRLGPMMSSAIYEDLDDLVAKGLLEPHRAWHRVGSGTRRPMMDAAADGKLES